MSNNKTFAKILAFLNELNKMFGDKNHNIFNYYKVCKNCYNAFYYDPFGDMFVMSPANFASPKLCRAYLEGINTRQNRNKKKGKQNG